MTDQHPITPPPELIKEWMTEARSQDYCSITEQVANHAAQWGYDQRDAVNEAKLQQARDEELEACCEWLNAASYGDTLGSYTTKHVANDLRAARRPKPPSLKDLALSELETILNELHGANGSILTASAIRRALEALPDD